jgi:hypothetical protein
MFSGGNTFEAKGFRGDFDYIQCNDVGKLTFADGSMQMCKFEDCERLINAKTTLSSLTECIVCLEAPRTAMLLPCRHFAYCENCVPGIDTKCHICREDVKEIIHGVFLL